MFVLADVVCFWGYVSLCNFDSSFVLFIYENRTERFWHDQLTVDGNAERFVFKQHQWKQNQHSNSIDNLNIKLYSINEKFFKAFEHLHSI